MVVLARPPVHVEAVRAPRQLDEFLRLPWRIYRDDPNWVPPLLDQQRTLLDRSRHPFHQHAEVEYFLARRSGEVVGRIAATVNHQHNQFHRETTGFFGFFESVDDREVARALLAASAGWLQARGMTVLRGPASFSSNEEWALLVEGFDGPPFVMMTYNPPYYQHLLEGCGLVKAKDLLAYWTDKETSSLEQRAKFTRVVETISRRVNLTVRPADLQRFDAELKLLKEIYNQAWERSWGFVPLTDAEIDFAARELRPVIDPHLCWFAFVGDRPVGAAIGVPDLNVALKHANGRLWPVGLLKILWHTRVRKIRRFRFMILGVVHGYQKRGIDMALIAAVVRAALERGYTEAEFSWVLEDNHVLNNMFLSWGLKPYRRYRVYEAPLAALSGGSA
jgi:GNAT superfamily N-acetyltransferase